MCVCVCVCRRTRVCAVCAVCARLSVCVVVFLRRRLCINKSESECKCQACLAPAGNRCRDRGATPRPRGNFRVTRTYCASLLPLPSGQCASPLPKLAVRVAIPKKISQCAVRVRIPQAHGISERMLSDSALVITQRHCVRCRDHGQITCTAACDSGRLLCALREITFRPFPL